MDSKSNFSSLLIGHVIWIKVLLKPPRIAGPLSVHVSQYQSFALQEIKISKHQVRPNPVAWPFHPYLPNWVTCCFVPGTVCMWYALGLNLNFKPVCFLRVFYALVNFLLCSTHQPWELLWLWWDSLCRGCTGAMPLAMSRWEYLPSLPFPWAFAHDTLSMSQGQVKPLPAHLLSSLKPVRSAVQIHFVAGSQDEPVVTLLQLGERGGLGSAYCSRGSPGGGRRWQHAQHGTDLMDPPRHGSWDAWMFVDKGSDRG